VGRHTAEDHWERRGNGPLRDIGADTEKLADLVDLAWPKVLLHCVGNGHAASIAESNDQDFAFAASFDPGSKQTTPLDGRWTMGGGRWAMDDGRWMMDDGRWAMGDGRWTMDDA